MKASPDQQEIHLYIFRQHGDTIMLKNRSEYWSRFCKSVMVLYSEFTNTEVKRSKYRRLVNSGRSFTRAMLVDPSDMPCQRERDMIGQPGLLIAVWEMWEHPCLSFIMGRPLARIISTLCPKRLEPSDYIDISGISQPIITLPCGTTRLRGHKNDQRNPFPPNTRGFLYYHTPPKAPPFVGELRLRCANSLEDFPNGMDLLSTDKFNPWSIPLSSLANKTTYLTLRAQLMLDGLTSQTTLDTWATKVPWLIGPTRPVLYYFRQPFLFRFDYSRLAFYTATKDQIGTCNACSPIGDHRGILVYPYGGKLSSQF